MKKIYDSQKQRRAQVSLYFNSFDIRRCFSFQNDSTVHFIWGTAWMLPSISGSTTPSWLWPALFHYQPGNGDCLSCRTSLSGGEIQTLPNAQPRQIFHFFVSLHHPPFLRNVNINVCNQRWFKHSFHLSKQFFESTSRQVVWVAVYYVSKQDWQSS